MTSPHRQRRLIHILVGAVVLALVVWGLVALLSHAPTASIASEAALPTIQLDGQTIHVTIASTDASRELGLGGRTGLAPDEGMLFVFRQDGLYQFWMKDMRFSIDILWLTADGKVIYIVPNLSPSTYPQAFGPAAQARYVLELSAGYAAAHGVKVGDVVQLQ